MSKASGLAAALAELSLAPDDTMAIGDAENDIDMLQACGWGVAVANALPAVKARADHVTVAANGAGVREAIALWLAGGIRAPRAPRT